MKKIITLVLALAMAVSLFTGCGKKNNAETGESDSNMSVRMWRMPGLPSTTPSRKSLLPVNPSATS